jgi:hypothetical protein
MTSPFKLLDAYGARDKDFFYGRDSEIQSLYHLLQQTRLTLVYGASGTGKTSLINAGLPKVFKITDWFKITVRRRDDINIALREAVGSHIKATLTAEQLPGALRRIFEEKWIPVYLVFDQFEEIFTLGNPDERLAFFETLKNILQENSAVKIILSMREEYIGHLYEYERIIPTLFDKRFRVEAMKDNTITSVISRTCRYHGVQLEKGDSTAEEIKGRLKIGKQPVHLPHLQIYLYFLYEKAMAALGKPLFSHALVADENSELGKVLNRFIHGKIADAQAELQQTNPGLAHDFAERLLDDFATNEGTKMARRVDELAERHQQPPGFIRQALQYFDEKAKLLRADEDAVDRYEPVHDLVAQQIHEARSAEEKAYRLFLNHLKLDYERWTDQNRDDKRLLAESDLAKVAIYQERLKEEEKGSELLQYQERSKAYWIGLKEKERRQLEEEQRLRREAEKSEERAGKRKRLAVFVSVIALGLAIFAGWSYLEAESARKEAEQKTKETKAALKQVEMEKDSTEEQRRIAEAMTGEAKENLKKAKVALLQVEKEKAHSDTLLYEKSEALDKYEQEKAERKANQCKKLLADAKIFMASGDFPLAKARLESALNILPNDEETLTLLKQCEKK